MSNMFDWNKENYLEYYVKNHQEFKDKIVNQECIKIFHKLFSANQVLFYAHISLVRLQELFNKMNNVTSITHNFEELQKFQTMANFYMFSFIQIIMPYKDIVQKLNRLSNINNDCFCNCKDQFDFFRSIRNMQTHAYMPVFVWSVHKNFKSKIEYVHIVLNKNILESIERFKYESKSEGHKNFEDGGYEFIMKNKDTPIYILASNFLDNLYQIHKKVFDNIIKKYGSDLDECEFYLEKTSNYAENIILNIFKRYNIPIPEQEKECFLRHKNIIRYFGGLPQIDYSEELEKNV